MAIKACNSEKMIITLVIKTLFSIILITGFHNPGKPVPVRNTSIIKYGTLSFSTNRVLETSPGLFNLLNYELIQQNQDGIWRYTEGVILPMKTKLRLFGNSPALGKIINVDSHQLEIVGVVRDIPEKSCLCCDLIILSRKLEMPVGRLTEIRCLILL